MSKTSRMFAKACAFADKIKNADQKTPDDIVRFDDISYGPDPVWNLLDVYRPRDAKAGNQAATQADTQAGSQADAPAPLPVIIDVHGGGWVYGDKYVYQYYCMSLAQRGFAVVNFSYRLAPEHVFPAGMQDLDAVVRFVLSNSGTYGFDLSNVFLVGDSAGAHMALMYTCMCTNPEYAELLAVIPPEGFMPKGIVLNCGIYDICEMLKDNGASVVLLRPLTRDLMGVDRIPEKLTAAQEGMLRPVKYVGKTFPPVFVMTSTGDFLKSQPDCLLPVLKQNSISHVFRIFGSETNKLNHVFHCDLRLPDAALCNDAEAAFLKGLL